MLSVQQDNFIWLVFSNKFEKIQFSALRTPFQCSLQTTPDRYQKPFCIPSTWLQWENFRVSRRKRRISMARVGATAMCYTCCHSGDFTEFDCGGINKENRRWPATSVAQVEVC